MSFEKNSIKEEYHADKSERRYKDKTSVYHGSLQ